MSRILSAVAWPYANGPRHIGHVAGFGVPSDIFSRYMRMAGNEVLMVSGTDEHGTPILVLAEQEGVGPQELADRYNRVIVEDLTNLGLSYDLFTRTTTRNHYAVVQEMFRTVHKNGYMIEQSTMGAISPSTGRTLPDRYVEGTCPICGYDGARGDQCDNCGNQLDAIDLINPHSRINGETPKFVESTHFFLDLPAFASALEAWLRTRTDWRPNVLNFSLNLIDDLRPRAMTRDIDWGIPVPLEGWETTRTSACTSGSTRSSGTCRRRSSGRAAAATPTRGARSGTTPTALSYYFMGKDNITFHSQIWPAELLAYDGGGTRGGDAGAVRDAQPAHRGGLERVPHHGGQAVLLVARRGHLRARRAVPLPAGRAALLPVGQRPREPGLGLHVGGLQDAHQHRARRRLGQPGQPHGQHDRQELRRDPGGR